MKGLKISLILFYCFILFACPDKADPIDSTLIIVNNSNENIVYKIEFNLLGDTSLQTFSFPLTTENIENRIILTNEQDSISEGFINYLENSNEILMVYLLSKDTIDQVPWERIRDDNLVLRRYDLTLEDLESLNWTIEYP